MKKSIITLLALVVAVPLFGQSINWDFTPINTMLRTMVPNILAIACVVVLLGWTMWNLVTNWKDRAEIFTTLFWGIVIVVIAYLTVYTAINILL